MQLLKDAVPHTVQAAVLLNPNLPYEEAQWRQLELAGRSLKVMLRQLVVRQASELDSAFTAIARDGPDALVVVTSSVNFVNRRRDH